MHINELIGSLISHESRMTRYVDNPLENAFKSKLHVIRGRGRGRSSSRGRWGRTTDHRDSKNDSKSQEKTHQNPPSLRGSSSRSWQ